MAGSLAGLEKILNEVQGSTLNTNVCNEIMKVLDHDNNIKPQLIQKLLDTCIRNPIDDVKYVNKTLNIALVILRKLRAGDLVSEPDLLPSLLETLNTINSSIYSCSSDKIKMKYFEILTSYPDEIYLKLKEDSAVLELLNLYVHQRIPIELRVQPINFLHKYLKVLPSDKRLKFVENGINIWFLKLVPSVMLFATIPDFDIETPLAALEIIVDEFSNIDYYDNLNWQCILQCFYEPQKYPTIMKNLLTKGSDIWHRLWIVFIKMLKNHLTKSGSSGSPINSMLPVVETAFKMDIKNRCRAFQCWSVLIDNFSTETNETYINKRIKLLIIPLYSNNAKFEETVIVKINTWWNLICRYHSKLSNFAEIILIPFLQFCFGKPTTSAKITAVPGMLNDKTKEYSVEALINIIGHHNCNGCVSLPVLEDKIINENFLCDNGTDLMYCLGKAIRIVAIKGSKLWDSFHCSWLSCIKSISDLPNGNIRRDIFKELLVMLENVVKDVKDVIQADVLLNLILTFFEGDDQMKQLLIPLDEQDSPMHRILAMILNSSLDSTYSRRHITFKPITDFIVEHCVDSSMIEALLNELLPNSQSLALWTALTSSLCEKKSLPSTGILYKVLLWPLNNLDIFIKVEFSTSQWLSLFEFVHTHKSTFSTSHDILQVIIDDALNINEENSLFFLNVAIVSLIQKMSGNKGMGYKKEVWLLYDTFKKIHDFTYKHPLFTKFIDVIHQLFTKLVKDVNINIARRVLMILKLVFTQLLQGFKKSAEIDAVFLLKIEQVLKSVNDLLKLEAYGNLKQTVLTEFLEYAECFGRQQLLKETIIATLQIFLESTDCTSPVYNTIVNMLVSLKKDTNSKIPSDPFTTPVTKKTKKKETSIVNTVVEDGEEFVVVKSNWKFNPKKLTDNQKEKLKRKREDIPALYQDLSQSQDEFKLSTWKTDSQDTTTTGSKSNDLTTSEKVSTILKNMPNTDVVPKILKNILTDNEKINSTIESTNEHNIKIQKSVNKDIKPRLSLKDRIFRNVKILLEKSDVQTDEEHVKSVIDEVPQQLQTPTGMRIKITEINSAPTVTNSDRPSRVKRKPKKFEEMQIFNMKKKRHSLHNNESQNKELFEDTNHSQDIIENSEAHQNKLNSSNTVSQNQENENILATILAEVKVKDNDVQSKNILNIDDVKSDQGETFNNEQQSSKSSVVESVLRIETENKVAGDNSKVTETDKNELNNDHLNTKVDKPIQNPLNKKTVRRKSRIEKELAIDMVEGHPFLKVQSEKRLTRKKASEPPFISRRKSLTQKLNKSKSDQKNTPNVDKKIKEIEKLLDNSRALDNSTYSQDSFQDENGSQDIIESSQDSTVSIMSVKSSKTVKRIPVVTLENIEHNGCPDKTIENDKSLSTKSKIFDSRNTDDSEFPLNKTAAEHIEMDLTQNFDTQPIGNISSYEIIEIKDEEEPPIVVNTDSTYIDMDTQEIADADTQPVDSSIITIVETITPAEETKSLDDDKFKEHAIDSISNITSTSQTREKTINPSDDTKSFDADKFQDHIIDSVSNIDPSTIETHKENTRPTDENKKVDADKFNEHAIDCTSIIDPSTVHTQEVSTNSADETKRLDADNIQELAEVSISNINILTMPTQNESTRSLRESSLCVREINQNESSSKLSSKDEDQRKQDFLSNTLEISPIKALSPVRENKSPSPETSSDYVVIKLSSPVQSNGEPFEKCDSPEIFTEEKVSPDKRDQSPPREEARLNTASPRSLSLKKNKPQVRSGGRAAQMLGLCIPGPERLQTLLNSEKSVEPDEPKKSSPLNSSARRNLRILYNSANETNEVSEDNEESKNFLKMNRNLPPADSSPSVPILKRKLADIVDDATVSPANKRKRVSFHDPPVSTTVCVKKYIESSNNVRSPQSSLAKRQERQMRSQLCVNLKSPKCLETVFKLDTALTKAVESFNDGDVTLNSTEDTEMSSLEPTPLVEVVKNRDLNDVDPICRDLINCNDPIDNIAGDLSSSAMRQLLVKEFAGKIETVGDLAKMTELEVNRLCIKAPKVQVAKKVLMEYAKKISTIASEMTPMTEAAFSESTVLESKTVEVGMQTDCIVIGSVEVQTEALTTSLVSTQTDAVSTVDCDVQANESDITSTSDIAFSLLEKPDFCEYLKKLLDVPSKQNIASSLPLNELFDAVVQEIDLKRSSEIIDKLLEKYSSDSINGRNDNPRLSFMINYLSDRFSSKDLILFCSDLLKKIHDSNI